MPCRAVAHQLALEAGSSLVSCRTEGTAWGSECDMTSTDPVLAEGAIIAGHPLYDRFGFPEPVAAAATAIIDVRHGVF